MIDETRRSAVCGRYRDYHHRVISLAGCDGILPGSLIAGFDFAFVWLDNPGDLPLFLAARSRILPPKNDYS